MQTLSIITGTTGWFLARVPTGKAGIHNQSLCPVVWLFCTRPPFDPLVRLAPALEIWEWGAPWDQGNKCQSDAMAKILLSHSSLKTLLSFGADVQARYEKSAVRSGGKS